MTPNRWMTFLLLVSFPHELAIPRRGSGQRDVSGRKIAQLLSCLLPVAQCACRASRAVGSLCRNRGRRITFLGCDGVARSIFKSSIGIGINMLQWRSALRAWSSFRRPHHTTRQDRHGPGWAKGTIDHRFLFLTISLCKLVFFISAMTHSDSGCLGAMPLPGN